MAGVSKRSFSEKFKPCKWCSKIFFVKRTGQEFCSKKCGRHKFRQKQCRKCSSEFTPIYEGQLYCCINCANSTRRVTHGLSKTRAYQSYKCMIRRCYSKRSKDYADYGGRGITVCDESRNDFMAFYNWAINRPDYADDKSLDRYPNNDGNYEPGNCRWATDEQQANNKGRT